MSGSAKAEEEDAEVTIEDGSGESTGKPFKCCSVKVLQMVIAILIFFILLLIFLWVFTASIGSAKCTTAECLMAAADMKKNMNSSVNPCDDFYEFACGNFIATQRIPPGKQAQTTINILRDKVTRRVKDILASDDDVTDRVVNAQLKKARFAYRQCLESELFGSSKTILEKVFSKVKPLPVLQGSQWSGLSKSAFMQQMIKVSALGVRPIFHVVSEIDSYNTKRYQLVINDVDQSPYLMDRFAFLENSTAANQKRKAYKKFVFDVLSKIYKDFNFASERVDADAIVEAQIKMTRLTQLIQQRRNDSLLMPMTVKQLIGKKTWNKLDWGAYFKGLGDFTNNKNFFKKTDLKIAVRGLDYLKKVDDLFNSIPNFDRIIGQIITFELAIQVMDHLRYDFRSFHETFNKESGGIFKFFSRENICNTYVLSVFEKVISRVYSDLYFDIEAKEKADEMIEAIREAFDRGLSDVDWIDEKTRKQSKEKLRLIIPKIGFDPNLLIPTTFQEEEIPDYKNFIDSMIRVQFKNAKKEILLATEYIDRQSKYYLNPLMVNAMYMPTLNTIEFPMAILTVPLFNKKNPGSLNFGAIGSVIGHELLHAFDDRGSKRDKTGNLKVWWPSEILNKFKEKTNCLVRQYSNYKSPYGDNLNGKLTLPENIADQAGMKYSFQAYQRAVAKGLATYEGLPELPYTGDQLFFINFAQMYCGKVTEQYWKSRIRKSPHSPYRYRVMGVLSTSKHFQGAFRCSDSSPMVAKSCPVW